MWWVVVANVKCVRTSRPLASRVGPTQWVICDPWKGSASQFRWAGTGYHLVEPAAAPPLPPGEDGEEGPPPLPDDDEAPPLPDEPPPLPMEPPPGGLPGSPDGNNLPPLPVE